MVNRTGIAIVLVFAVLAAGCIIPVQEQSTRVTDVVDGDTVVVETDGKEETVRLIGIDTPETRGDVSPQEFGFKDIHSVRACLREEAKEATEYVRQSVLSEPVALSSDPNTENRGSYGRLLRYIEVNESSLNKKLVEKGYARVYTNSDFSLKSNYLAAEAEARQEERNVWSCGTASSNRYIFIINADAGGDDRLSLNGEYVVLQNPTNNTISLDGWTVMDDVGHTYEFDGRELNPDERLVLRTGSGTANETTVYWGSSSPIWNNGGDTVTVRNETGGVISKRSYS